MDNGNNRIIKFNNVLKKDRLKLLESWKGYLFYMGLPTKYVDEKIEYYCKK